MIFEDKPKSLAAQGANWLILAQQTPFDIANKSVASIYIEALRCCHADVWN